MGVDKGFCVEVFTAYPLQRYIPFVDGAVGIGGLILGFVYFAMSLLTLFLIRLNRRNALQGMEGAAMRVIFPIYLPLLLLSALSDTFVGLVVLFVPFKTRESNDWDAAIILATAYAIQHLVIEGSAFTLMQYGCGYQAFRNSIFWASGWALTTFLVKLAFYRQGADNDVAFALNFSWDIILFVFYFLLWTLPETRLYRRTAVRYYATFWTFIHLSVIIADAMYYFGKGSEDTTSLCIDSLVTLPIFVLCKPYVVYKSLLLDSVWWQGLPARSSGRGMGTGSGKTGNSVGDASLTDSLTKAFFRIVAGTSSHGGGSERGGAYERIRAEGGSDRSSNLSQRDSSLQSNDMLSGLLHPNSSRVAGMGGSGAGGSNSGKRLFEGKQYDSIQQPLDGVEVGFHEAQELAKEVDYIHQQGTTRFINSAHLTLDKPQRLLGAGSFSKVYAGYYKGSPVAMKMLFTQDINPDVIRRCSNEARILTEVSYSPHVVKIYGISVFPPSVCLVLELCPFGSLSDVLRGSNVQGVERPALKLTLADRMHLALGCALGLAALHNYSPDLCHRDIKSFNFLIDGQLNAKIADLDLGQQVVYPQKRSYSSDQSVNNTRQSLNSRGGGGDGVTSATAYHGSGMNITWQAPEVLLGQGYTQKSDVYSLALVLWEIIASGRTMKKFSSSTYGGGGGGDIANMNITSTSIPVSSIPFNDCKDQREVREKIVLGYRPSLSSFITSFDQQEGGNSKDQKTSRRRSKSPIPPLTHNTSSFTSNNDTNVSKVYVDILYLDLITRAWSPEPRHRPSIDRLAEGLKRCYSNCLHRFITDTHFLVQYEKIHEEHVKMSLLHNTNQPLQALPVSTSPHLRGGGMEAYHSMNRRTTGLSSSYPRNAPSRELIEAVSAMKAEVQWSKLEDDGAYVIITPIAPYYMLWATKRWTQVMGYFVNDLLGLDISLLFGPKTDVMALLSLLSTMITGHSLHIMSSLYRRDGREMTFSLNIFPVFDATGTTPIDSVPTSLDSSLQNTRTLLHATTFSPAHVHAPATPSQPSQTLPPPSPAPLLPPTPERTSSVGDTVLTQPPVGFLDLFSRSSSEFTTAKDFHIPATPSRGDVSQVRSISRGPPLTSDVESADRVTSPMKKGGGGNPLHFLPSDDESDTGGAGLLPSERSRMMDPTTSDIFSMSGTSMSNRKVAYIVLHFSSLK